MFWRRDCNQSFGAILKVGVAEIGHAKLGNDMVDIASTCRNKTAICESRHDP